jgi:cytochrome c biogenesis protein CcmG, thiol:disulfide interchange protein DsbE
VSPKILRLMPLSVFVFAAILLGAVLMSERKPPQSEALIGTPFPDVAEAPTLSGIPASGDYRIVNFFASWCMPCRAEHPALMALEADGAALLGVAWKDSPAAIADYLTELDDPFAAVVLDTEGHLGKSLGIQGAPETFVLDEAGMIAFHWSGPITPEVLSHIQSLLPSDNH